MGTGRRNGVMIMQKKQYVKSALEVERVSNRAMTISWKSKER